MLNILFLTPKPLLLPNSSSSLLREFPVLGLWWVESLMWPLWKTVDLEVFLDLDTSPKDELNY